MAQSGGECGEAGQQPTGAAQGQHGDARTAPGLSAAGPGFAAAEAQAAYAPGQPGMQQFGPAHPGGSAYAGGQPQQGPAMPSGAPYPGTGGPQWAAGNAAPGAGGYAPMHGVYPGQQGPQFAAPMYGGYPHAGMGMGGPAPAPWQAQQMPPGGYPGMYAAHAGGAYPPYAGVAGNAPGMAPGVAAGMGQGAGRQGPGMAEVFDEIANGGNGLSSIGKLLNFDDSEFWKGALIGAAAVLLLTNDSVQDLVFKTGAKAKDAVKSGADKIKETAGEAAAKAKP
jgi:hypothetical protein